MINIFYEEPQEVDRWFIYDRFPRMFLRRIIRGKRKPGGVEMVALGLMAGLDSLNIPYRFNDYQYIRAHPKELACVIGKPHVLKKIGNTNPIIFGAGIFSHPSSWPDLLIDYPNIKQILVPGIWMKEMFIPYYGKLVEYWPVGIDTSKWCKTFSSKQKIVIYYKIRWDHDVVNAELFFPIVDFLKSLNCDFEIIYYGSYKPNDLLSLMNNAKFVIFLCEHETQGIAYQQILATDTPIYAWDRGGYWTDPSFFPEIKFSPVSSVPYWDDNCGLKFKDFNDFISGFSKFVSKVDNNDFCPRTYIKNNLTLEGCAQKYIDIINPFRV